MWPTVSSLQAPGLQEYTVRIRSHGTLMMLNKCYNGCIDHMNGIVYSTQSKNLDCWSLCLLGEETNKEVTPHHTTSNYLTQSFS